MDAHAGPRLQRLPYLADVARRFAVLAQRPWAAWLDSGHPAGGGRFDICVAEPRVRVLGRDGGCQVGRGDAPPLTVAADPFQVLRAELGPRRAAVPGIPFGGGAVGYFGYELGSRLEGVATAGGADAWPELAVGIYDCALVTDHLLRRSWWVEAAPERRPAPARDALLARLADPPPLAPAQAGRLDAELVSNFSPAAYAAAFRRIQHYIREGDCYQVNLAQRFSAPVAGSPWETYRRQREDNPAPYGAYLNLPFGQVLSSSPEQFLGLSAGQVITRPIKGTRPRGATRAQDDALRAALRESEKDRAENLMIVDLLRNDLGKVCRPGSIRVPELFKVESFATVHHLVSTVTGELRPDSDALQLLRSCFPGGSITGAPKHRAMQVIAELEPHRRDVYCGSIGWIGFDGAMDTSVAIRTLLWSGGQVRYWAGGGIVADSELDSEYRETFTKAAALFRLFGRQPGVSGPKFA